MSAKPCFERYLGDLRFPDAPALLHDESISSFLDRIGFYHRIGTTCLPNLLAEHLGIFDGAANVDWDTDPIAEVLRLVERACRLDCGRLDSHRLPHSLFNLAPEHRMAVCPLCAARDMQRGSLPGYRRQWALAVRNHCTFHGVPLLRLSTANPVAAKEQRTPRQSTMWRFCRAWDQKPPKAKLQPQRFTVFGHREFNEYAVTAARTWRREFCNKPPAIRILWNEQVEFESHLVRAMGHQPMPGAMSVLGCGPAFQRTIRDLFALIVTKMDSGPEWPLVKSVEFSWIDERRIMIFDRWPASEITAKHMGDRFQLQLTHGSARPEVRRTALHVLKKCIENLLKMETFGYPSGLSPDPTNQFPQILKSLPEWERQRMLDLSARWTPFVREALASWLQPKGRTNVRTARHRPDPKA